MYRKLDISRVIKVLVYRSSYPSIFPANFPSSSIQPTGYSNESSNKGEQPRNRIVILNFASVKKKKRKEKDSNYNVIDRGTKDINNVNSNIFT